MAVDCMEFKVFALHGLELACSTVPCSCTINTLLTTTPTSVSYHFRSLEMRPVRATIFLEMLESDYERFV
jgi:hypothetical protein